MDKSELYDIGAEIKTLQHGCHSLSRKCARIDVIGLVGVAAPVENVGFPLFFFESCWALIGLTDLILFYLIDVID